MRPCIRITDHVSVCDVLISSGNMFSKTAVTVIPAFSYDFSTETDLVWYLIVSIPDLCRAFLTYLGRPGQFAMGAKLFIRIPLIRKQVILKNKPVWAM